MITNQELFEKYFDKALTQEEKALFKEKYDTDPDFKKELEQYAQLIMALKIIKEEEKKSATEGAVATAAIETIPPKRPWILLSTIVAAASVVLFVLFFSHLQENQMRKELAVLSDSLKGKDINEIEIMKQIEKQQIEIAAYQQQIDSLHKNGIPSTVTPLTKESPLGIKSRNILIARLETSKEMQTKGESPIRFLSDNKKSFNPTNITIKWKPVNKQADIFLYLITEDENEDKKIFDKKEYDLNAGYYTLPPLEKDNIYSFEIKIGNNVYKFPFYTQ